MPSRHHPPCDPRQPPRGSGEAATRRRHSRAAVRPVRSPDVARVLARLQIDTQGGAGSPAEGKAAGADRPWQRAEQLRAWGPENLDCICSVSGGSNERPQQKCPRPLRRPAAASRAAVGSGATAWIGSGAGVQGLQQPPRFASRCHRRRCRRHCRRSAAAVVVAAADEPALAA